jgi:hypothetical protein
MPDLSLLCKSFYFDDVFVNNRDVSSLKPSIYPFAGADKCILIHARYDLDVDP